MKYTFSFLIIITLLTSCNQKLSNCIEKTSSEQSALYHVSLDEMVTAPELFVKYEIEKYNYSETCWLTYPILSGMSDLQLQDKVNLIFKEAAFDNYLADKEFKENKDSDSISELNYILECEVKLCNDRIISILYSVAHYWHGSAMNTDDSYTVNIDLETGRQIRLEQFYKVDDLFVEALMCSKTSVDNFVTTDGDSSLEFVRLKYASSPSDHTYFTRDYLGATTAYLITSYYAVYDFEIPYKDLEHWIRQAT